jgi:hypothetical protein
MRIIIAATTAAIAIGLVGCGKSDTKVYSNGKDSVAVSQSGDHMTVTGSNGEKVEFGSGTNATANTPSYLPLYPGAKVTASFTGSGKDGAGGMVSFQSSAAPADIINFYKPKVTAAGMAQTASMEMGATTTYAAANETSKRSVSVTATKGGDGTTVQLAWSGK